MQKKFKMALTIIIIIIIKIFFKKRITSITKIRTTVITVVIGGEVGNYEDGDLIRVGRCLSITAHCVTYFVVSDAERFFFFRVILLKVEINA